MTIEWAYSKLHIKHTASASFFELDNDELNVSVVITKYDVDPNV